MWGGSMKRVMQGFAVMLMLSACSVASSLPTSTPLSPCFDCDAQPGASPEPLPQKRTGPSLLATFQPTASTVLDPKLLTVTAIMLVRQMTVDAGPRTPLPQDLYTPTLEVGSFPVPDYPFSPHRAAGDGILVEDSDHPPMWEDKGTVNFWRATYADIVVYAGWLGPDFYPGVYGALFVVGSGADPIPEVYVAPVPEGALKIEDAYGHVLIVRTALGDSLLAFDVDSRKYVPTPGRSQARASFPRRQHRQDRQVRRKRAGEGPTSNGRP